MIIGTDSIRNVLCIIVWHVLKKTSAGYSFMCKNDIAFKTVVLPV